MGVLDRWHLRASYWAFLYGMGVLSWSEAAPQSSQELERHCGVVAIEDDGLCAGVIEIRCYSGC